MSKHQEFTENGLLQLDISLETVPAESRKMCRIQEVDWYSGG